jgi:hypothetical protein
VAIETAQLLEALGRHRDQLSKENAQLRQEIEGRFSIESSLKTAVADLEKRMITEAHREGSRPESSRADQKDEKIRHQVTRSR